MSPRPSSGLARPASWGVRWLLAAGVVPDPPRRGGRRGRTLSFQPGPDGVRAELAGSDGVRRLVTLSLPDLPRRTAQALLTTLAGKAVFAASLLAGEVPQALEEAGAAALFPQTPLEPRLTCACGRGAMRCEHVERLHHLLAELLDRDPLVLLELRGIPRAGLFDRLRDDAGANSPEPRPGRPGRGAEGSFPREPLPDVPPDAFFKPSRPADQLRVPLGAPENPEAVLTLLGPSPLLEPEARELLLDLHRAIGLGARERLSDWEWRRATPPRGQV